MMTKKKKKPKTKRMGRPKGEKPPKKLRSIKLEPEFEERLRRAAYWARTTVNAILEEGAAIVLERLERGNAKPFDPIPTD